jgi:hypothetical protein
MNQNQEFWILGYKMQERCQSLHTIYILIINHSIRFFWIIPWIGQEVAKPSAVEAPSAKFGKSNRDSKGCPVTGDLGLLPASVCWNQSWISHSVPLVSECKQQNKQKQTWDILGFWKGCTAGVLNAPATVGMALAKGYIQGMTAKDRRLLLSYLPWFIPSTRGDQKYTKIHSTSMDLLEPFHLQFPSSTEKAGRPSLANMSPTAHRQTSIALCARPSTAITGSWRQKPL